MSDRRHHTPAEAPAARPARWPVALLAAAIIVAYVAPRAVVLSGISQAAIVEFADMADHLYFLDLVGKGRTLADDQRQDPFFLAFPETRPRMLAIQWPPGLYQLVSLWAPTLGPGSLWTTLLTNALFSLLIILATIGLGSSLVRAGAPPGDGLRLGLWAGLLVTLSPPLVASTWYFSLDYPLIGMTTVGLLLLWWTRNFTRPLPLLAFAVWSALGTVIKPTYALYLLGPAAALLLLGIVRAPRRRWLPPLQTAVALAISAGLMLWLYQPDFAAIGTETRVHFWDRTLPGATTDPWTVEWFVSNIKFAMANYPWPLLILVVPGLLWLHLRRQIAGRWLILSLLYSTYLFLTLLANKMERYIQPVYPVFCLLTVAWIVDLVPRRFRVLPLGALVAGFVAMLVYTHIERPIPWLPEPRQAIPMASAYHPFRYEFHMPTQEQLERLRRRTWDSECQFSPLVKQVQTWMSRIDPLKRPLGMVYVRNLRARTVGHPPMPFRKLIPAVVQTVRDRFVIVGNLHLMEYVPPALLRIPTLVVLHGPEVKPEVQHPELRLLQRKTIPVRCRGKTYPFVLTLAQPRQTL